jgi:hypothetical protein
LIGLEESGFGLNLGHRPDFGEEFLLAPIHPPLIAFSGPSENQYIRNLMDRYLERVKRTSSKEKYRLKKRKPDRWHTDRAVDLVTKR